MCVLSCNDDFGDRPSGFSCSFFFDLKNTPILLLQKLKAAETDEELLEIASQLNALGEDHTGFYCNDMRDPDIQGSFKFSDPFVQKSRSMPKDTARIYEEYIRKKVHDLKEKCGKTN